MATLPYDTDKLIKETQAMLAQTKAEGDKAYAGSSFQVAPAAQQVAQPSVQQAITPADLNPVQPQNYATTTPTPVVPQVTLPEQQQQQQLGPEESEYSRLIKSLTQDINNLPSKSQFEAEQQQKFGYIDSVSRQNSIKAQFDALQNEAKALDLQYANAQQANEQAIQDIGRRAIVTKGGVAPFASAAQRELDRTTTALRIENTRKQLEAAASYAIVSNDVATALAKVNQAIAIEWQPKQDAIDRKLKNLEILKSDPALTREQEKRADDRQKKLEAEKLVIQTEAKNAETRLGLIMLAQQNGAPQALITQAQNEKDLLKVSGLLGAWAGENNSADIQEYYLYKREETQAGRQPISFDEWRTREQNRKVALAKAANGEFGLSQGQANLFNNIVTKYNASPLIAAADRTIVLKNSIEQARKNPSDGATQLNLVYSYIQALDTYQSAVREGELGLVNSIDSKVGALSNYVSQIQNGQIVRPEVANEIADAAENLVNTINQGAKSKEKSFESQAETLGLGDPWRKYRSGFQASYSGAQSTGSGASNMSTADYQTWLNTYNYAEDIRLAQQAIAEGKDRNAVIARLQEKYKDVSL